MASAQEAIVMNDAEKAVVEKMVEVAKSIGTTEKDMAVDAKNMQQNSAVVAMTNSTFASINFSKSHNWFGQITGSYPGVITKGSHATFTHKADAKNGSKGAVVYMGTNKEGMPCGWLLAWYAPIDPSPSTRNKVYVTCGKAANFDNVNWNQVQTKLDASADLVNYYDSTTKTAIHANIQPGANFASVGASFGAV